MVAPDQPNAAKPRVLGQLWPGPGPRVQHQGAWEVPLLTWKPGILGPCILCSCRLWGFTQDVLFTQLSQP